MINLITHAWRFVRHFTGHAPRSTTMQLATQSEQTAVIFTTVAPKYNRKQLKADIAAVTAEIRNLKKITRSPHTATTGVHQSQLCVEKWTATQLCMLAAHLRGRIHKVGLTREQQAEYIKHRLPKYTL